MHAKAFSVSVMKQNTTHSKQDRKGSPPCLPACKTFHVAKPPFFSEVCCACSIRQNGNFRSSEVKNILVQTDPSSHPKIQPSFAMPSNVPVQEGEGVANTTTPDRTDATARVPGGTKDDDAGGVSCTALKPEVSGRLYFRLLLWLASHSWCCRW